MALGAWRGPKPIPYADGDEFLLSNAPFDHPLFIVRLVQPGVRGVDLVRLIRRRSTAGIVSLCNRQRQDFAEALDAGADFVLPEDAPPEHLRAAVAAVQRRCASRAPAAPAGRGWRLLVDHSVLLPPDGDPIALSESDLALMRCFGATADGRVDRRTLVEHLWGRGAAQGAFDNALHASVYRLRKRIEQSGQPLAPLRAVAGVGYEFRAPLTVG